MIFKNVLGGAFCLYSDRRVANWQEISGRKNGGDREMASGKTQTLCTQIPMAHCAMALSWNSIMYVLCCPEQFGFMRLWCFHLHRDIILKLLLSPIITYWSCCYLPLFFWYGWNQWFPRSICNRQLVFAAARHSDPTLWAGELYLEWSVAPLEKMSKKRHKSHFNTSSGSVQEM